MSLKLTGEVEHQSDTAAPDATTQPPAPDINQLMAAARHASLMHVLCLGENAARNAAFALSQVQELGAIARANTVVVPGRPNVGEQAQQQAMMANKAFEESCSRFIGMAQRLASVLRGGH